MKLILLCGGPFSVWLRCAKSPIVTAIANFARLASRKNLRPQIQKQFQKCLPVPLEVVAAVVFGQHLPVVVVVVDACVRGRFVVDLADTLAERVIIEAGHERTGGILDLADAVFVVVGVLIAVLVGGGVARVVIGADDVIAGGGGVVAVGEFGLVLWIL
ncbi:hypothetical protein [Anaerohalosphaera lusitana]|uniref:hypothetical protein n=1 Tax=Anaerohalosphaera lusitana TaxID=1936003 RepID=UPI0011BAC588|nr:hypothetical protein [Anaerohalosphaera lusitana]